MVTLLVTGQGGNAWHCYIGRLISEGKMRFMTSRPGNTNAYLESNITGVITTVRSANSPNLVQIACEMAPPHGGEKTVKYNGYVTFFFRLFFFYFRFIGQPTGRNFSPNCTLNDSKVVLRLIHVLFGGLVPSNSL